MFKFVSKGVSAFLMVMTGATTLMPMTDFEIAALGPETNRYDLVQMRVAKAMMNVAPDFTVARMAQATGLPEDIIRDQLTAKAEGTTYAQHTGGNGVSSEPVDPLQDGGAKFIRVD